MTGRRNPTISDLKRRVERQPSNPVHWFNLSVLHQAEGDYEAQRACVAKAEKYGFRGPELLAAKAGLVLLEEKVAECITLNRQLLQCYPDYLPAYESIARLSWQYDTGTDPLVDCRNAARQRLEDIGLQKTYLRLLSESGSWQAVLDHIACLRSSIALPPAIPQEAVAWDRLGKRDKALELYRLCVQLDPEDTAVRVAFAECLLAEGHFQAAVPELQRVIGLEPNLQLAWAYLGLAWRLLGDEREHWLHDYGHLIRSFDIPAPAGYATRKAFLQKLKQALLARHTATREPMQQTLRGGTQTQGNLFAGASGVIAEARDQIARIVSDYCRGLPRDEHHPFLAGRTASFHFSGAWSVLLRSGGFHVSHVHDSGWLSSAFYVSLPNEPDTEEDKREGSLQFGLPPGELGLALSPRRSIQPEEGRLVLFPSYTWHGTVPFSTTGTRLTLAFDVLPA